MRFTLRKIEEGDGIVIKPEGLLEENKEGAKGSRAVFPKRKQKELEVLIYKKKYIFVIIFIE